MDNKNRDYHFFASDFVFDRIKTENLDNTKSLKDIGNITWKDFVPTSDEDLVYKKSLQILLGRIISMYASKFEWMKSVLPQHIEHIQDDAMSQKSEVCWMPVLMKNEACYSDCIQIMKSYEKQILQWYTKGGRGKKFITINSNVFDLLLISFPKLDLRQILNLYFWDRII